MLYKADKGKIKDGCMLYNDGRYYLYSMYQKAFDGRFNNIRLAVSDDGVHFKDYGCIVEDFQDNIWAMKAYKTDDGFYMNHGSFSDSGAQDTLKFWYSNDLIHWTYKPELDVKSPQNINNEYRLDCMNVVRSNDKYYGYATGNYCFLNSDNGINWRIDNDKTFRNLIDYTPFPVYNEALGGFEVADCIYLNEKYYLLCGGFGHIGTGGYGVFVYESSSPSGPFKPSFPNYRINGTSKRWVNMWERCFEKDGKYLAHNYMYDGYSYENGNVYLPPIKSLECDSYGLYLKWWSGNDILIGECYKSADRLTAVSPSYSVFETDKDETAVSESIGIENNTVAEFLLCLEKNTFTEYSKGGFYLAETENSGTAVLFDSYGKCEFAYVEDSKIKFIDDTICFGSASLYYLHAGETYNVRILIRGSMFEIYINDRYLQTFNTKHFTDLCAKPICGIAAASVRRSALLSDIALHKMNI